MENKVLVKDLIMEQQPNMFAVYQQNGELIKDGLSKAQVMQLVQSPDFKKYGKIKVELSPRLGDLRQSQALPDYKSSIEDDQFTTGAMFKTQAL